MSNFLFWNTFIAITLFIPKPILSCLVDTSSGPIRGKIITFNNTQIRSFLGIPYAEPPIGELRFKKPVPVRPWNNELQADKLPPGCSQYSPNPFPWLDELPGLSEDCLYLNIWTPMQSENEDKKSVMFWIHGGGFRISSSRLDFFNGEALVAEEDVIVVTFNYRLGALGFLYFETSDAPGNMGMLDMVEALKWVRNNIEYFGGDKDSITLFGQSSGGIAIGMFCVSPLTRNLFSRVIMQSGSPTNLDGENNDRSAEISQKLAEFVGCANASTTLKDCPLDVVACMRNVHASILDRGLAEVTKDNPRSYYPRYGDEFLPMNPRKLIADGDFVSIDVMIGNNNGDGASLLTKTMKEVFGFFGEKDPKINFTFGESILRNKFKDYSDPDAVVHQYLGDADENCDKIRFEVFTALGDYFRICPSVYFAESFASKNANVYFYFYTHKSSNTPWASWMLGVHFDETPFVFGYPLRYADNYTYEEQTLSRQMMQTWSSFAKTGKPIAVNWPVFSKENPTYQILDTGIHATGHGPHKSHCDFFRSHFGFQ